MDFIAHKARILELLNAPATDHSRSSTTSPAFSTSEPVRQPAAEEHKLKDRSPKGCLDAPIVDLVHMINSIPDYVTTSSCSGRIVLYAQEEKKWLYVVHEESKKVDVINTCREYFCNPVTATTTTATTTAATTATTTATTTAAKTATKTAINDENRVILMKTEPFILHVLCKSVVAAQALLQVSRDAGFRESGISVGKKSIICAVRTTGNSMEVPLTSSLATLEYLTFLVPYANDLFCKNKTRIHAFQKMVIEHLLPKQYPINPIRLKRWGHAVSVWSSSKIDRIVVVGGYAHDDGGRVARRMDVLVSSDDSNEIHCWYEASSMEGFSTTPSPRVRHTLTQLGHGNNQFLMYGGRSNPSAAMNEYHVLTIHERGNCNILSSWCDLSNNINEEVAGRWSHTATYQNVKKRSKERIWVYGGRDGKQVFQQMICISVKRRNGALNGDCGNVSSNDCRLNFDLSVVETDGQSPPGGRFSHTTTLINHYLIVIGGCSHLSGQSNGSSGDSMMMRPYLFDTIHLTWSSISSSIQRLYSHSSCLIKHRNNKYHLLVLGGVENEEQNQSSALVYDVTNVMVHSSSDSDVAKDKEMNKISQRLVQLTNIPQTVLLCRHRLVTANSKLYSIGGGSEVLSFGACFSEPPVLEYVMGKNMIQTKVVNLVEAYDIIRKNKEEADDKRRLLEEKGGSEKDVNKKNMMAPVIIVGASNVRHIKMILSKNNLLSKTLRIAKLQNESTASSSKLS